MTLNGALWFEDIQNQFRIGQMVIYNKKVIIKMDV